MITNMLRAIYFVFVSIYKSICYKTFSKIQVGSIWKNHKKMMIFKLLF